MTVLGYHGVFAIMVDLTINETLQTGAVANRTYRGTNAIASAMGNFYSKVR